MPSWKRIVVSGSDATLNTLTVSSGITGSLQGTASYATQALSASFAPSTPAFPFTGSAVISGSLNVIGNTTITGSLIVSGSTSTNLLVGTNALYVSSSGRVGLGVTSSLAATLHVKGGTFPAQLIGTTTNTSWDIAPLNIIAKSAAEGYNYGYSPAINIRPNGSNSYPSINFVQNGPTSYGAIVWQDASYPSYTAATTGTHALIQAYNSSTVGIFSIATNSAIGTTGVSTMLQIIGNKMAIGTVTPTSLLHLSAGTATANTAPIKLTAGTNLTTPEAGAVEFDGNSLFFTTGSTRSTILTSINPTSSTSINVQGLTIGKGKNSLENQYFTPTATSITTGVRNVGIGSSAGTSVTSGNYLVAIGYGAGVSITTGTHNTSVGGFAGYFSNGSYNTFVGMEANYRAAGNYNVAVGFDCMFENTGTRNTGVGPYAGISVATGNDNAYFGYNAGRYIADGVTSSTISSASVFLGVDSRPLASSQTNQIVIGYQAIGLGSNTVVIGNNSITTTALKGNTQVSGSLSVSGSTTIRGNTAITGSLYNSSFAFISGGLVVGSELGGYVQSGDHKSQITATGTQTPLMIQGGSGAVQIWKDTTPSRAVSFGMAVPGGSITNDFIFSAYQYSWAETMRITSDGSVGIGTTTPNAKLDVNGNAVITGSLLLSGSSLVAGITPIPLAGTIQDGVTSVLGNLYDWNSNFYQGTVLYSETAGGTITFGQLCYRTQNETWELADATAANSAAAFNMLGICVKSSTSTNPTSILINGFVETATYATIVKSGEPLYMATTAGSMTKTAPTTVGNAVRLIGHTFWDSNTNAKIIIRFNPENSWIEL